MFDLYTSLGENCEVAFQIRRILGQDESSFFSWNITSFEAFSSLINARFEGIMQPENLSPHGDGDLVKDALYDYMFHSDYPKVDGIDYASYPETTEAHQKKAGYLVEKFYHNARSGRKIAYFYKTTISDPKIVKARSLEMSQSIIQAGQDTCDFKLIIVQELANYEVDWGHPQIHNRYVHRFAPFSDAHDGHVSSWDRIFREFSHVGEMRYAGY